MKTLTAEQLKSEQERTLTSPRRSYSLLARLLFVTMDVLYGRKATLQKFKVLEIIARVPYQAWENVAYVAITHTFQKPDLSRRIYERVQESRVQQDNEQWHLLIVEELLRKRGIRQGFLRFWLMPQLIAFTYYHIAWILYVIKPSLSYGLNADFEDHAEHEYMSYVADHPELAEEPFESMFREDYGPFDTMADVFRQIGHDERMHKEESLMRLGAARFA